MALLSTRLVWLAFLALLAALVAGAAATPIAAGPFAIDRLTLFLGTAVLLVSGVVHAFAIRYMDGDAAFDAFFARLGLLTLTVLLLLAADHMVLFVVLWAAMGLLLASLIGHVRDWPAARAAARLSAGLFLAGSVALGAGLVLLGSATGTASIAEAIAGVEPGNTAWLVTLALLAAAMIQCSLVPFQRWLMSSMTAPTPVSAFMHAGLVNAGGILLARFAPVAEAVTGGLMLVFAVGLTSALLGAVALLVQTDIKRQLAASTVAQMGFMVMQCGLGFFAAAMAHLVLHGLYKAAQFLGAGSAITKGNRPGKAEAPAPTALTALGAVLAFAAAAGVFGTVTGKLAWDTGLILVLFAGFAGAQAVVGFRGEITPVRMVAVPGVVAVAALLYGGVVRLAELVLAPVPGLTAPQPLSWFHLVLTGVVAVVWLAVLAGAHRRSAAFYVRMLALFQPAPSTITAARETANA